MKEHIHIRQAVQTKSWVKGQGFGEIREVRLSPVRAGEMVQVNFFSAINGNELEASFCIGADDMDALASKWLMERGKLVAEDAEPYIHAKISDVVGGLGKGKIIDSYLNQDCPGWPATMFVCSFEDGTIADRLPDEIEVINE